jgi:hypothetical protein
MFTQRQSNFASPVIMLLSAAIFGYFGFFVGLTATTTSGEFVLFYAILLWTLRAGAIIFALAGILSLFAPLAGNIVYLLGSAVTAIGLLAVGVMDVLDNQRAAAIPPVLAFIFAAWNGYGAWASARELLASQPSKAA